MPLDHLLDVIYLIEYGVSHLIVRKNTSFTKVFYKLFALASSLNLVAM